MAMINPADALLSFGAIDYDDTAFPNVIDLNEGQTERMKVEVQVTEDFTGGTSIAFVLKGSDDDSTYVTIGTVTVALADLVTGNVATIPIPDGVNYRYLKIANTITGTFTGGAATAYLDTYLGR